MKVLLLPGSKFRNSMVRDEKFEECASVGLGPISLNFHNVMPMIKVDQKSLSTSQNFYAMSFEDQVASA